MAYRAAVELLRQQFEKGAETGLVESHPRCELPQDRPELFAEFEHAGGKEAVDRRACRGQIGAVSDKTRTLQRKDKILRRLVVPAAKTCRLLRAVEGAVDLDRSDLATRMRELARLRQALRIEDTAPWRKHPAADPDPDPRRGIHQSGACLSGECLSVNRPPSAEWSRVSRPARAGLRCSAGSPKACSTGSARRQPH